MPTSHLAAPVAVASAVACAVIWKRRTQCKRPAPKEPEPQKPERRVRQPSREPRDKHKVVGILQIDYVYTPVLGDVDNANTFGFHTRFARVKGLTFERAQRGDYDDTLRAAFLEAIAELKKAGPLVGISGNCGFMMWYQARVRELTSTPVFMSALMQAPLVEAAIGRDAKVLLLTANSKRLLAARNVLLREAGVTVDDPSKFVVQGVERLAGFEPLADPSLGTIDTEVARASLVDCVRSRIFADPSIACLLLECTELPPYEDALREATSLPVFSVVSLFSYFYGARQQSAFGRAEKEADAAAEQQKLLAQQALEAGELPPSREDNGDLRADAHRRVQISCERALASVRELVSETLADAAEADVNDVRGANVSGAVWGRLRLLERVRPMLAAQTKTDTVNEVPLAGLNIHVTDLFKHYLPLACSLHERYTAFRAAKLAAGGSHEAFVVGLNAPPGCGKSTLVQLLRLLLRAAAEAEGVDSLRVVHVSSDDLYMTKAQRAAAGVESRLKVESIDASLADSVLWALKRSTDASRVLIPRFNKGLDEREPEALWSVAEGRVDIVLYEGWRVGIDHPLYRRFNEAVDCLVCLEADIEAIRTWKLESSRRDAESAGLVFDEAKLMAAFERDIVPFVELYERPLLKRADLVLRKHQTHSIRSLDRALIEKLERIADFRLQTSGGSELTIDCVEETLGALGLRSAARWVFELLHRRGVGASLSKPLFVSVLATAIESSSATNKSFYFRGYSTADLPVGGAPGLAALHRARGGDEPFGCASGCSSRRFTPDAVHDAADQIDATLGMGCAPSLLVFHATASHDAHALRRTLRQRYPNSVLHGASSCRGVMTERGSCAPEHAHALALFAIVDPGGVYSSGLAPLPVVSAEAPGEAARHAGEHAGEQAALRAKASVEAAVGGVRPDVLVMSATPGCEEAVLRGVALVFPGVPVFGGSAADDGTFDKWFVVGTDSVLHGEGVLITAMFTSCHVAVSLASLHRPTEHRVLVTKLGADHRTIAELDHVPAAERYNELTGGAISRKLAELKSTPAAQRDELNIHLDSVLCPLGRVSFDGDGTRHFQLIEPGAITRDLAITTFAEVKDQEELCLLQVQSEGELVAAAEGAAQAAVGWTGPAFGQARGALLIYCAGCFLALQPHMATVAERIVRGMPKPDGKPLPFACGFTFGEQGPIGKTESMHANLMFNICLFGGPKRPAPPAVVAPPIGRVASTGKSLFRRVRQFLLHPDRFHSMSHLLAEFDRDQDSTITPREFVATLRRFGFELSEEERAMLINDIDRDGDGEISYTELFLYLQTGGVGGSPRGTRGFVRGE